MLAEGYHLYSQILEATLLIPARRGARPWVVAPSSETDFLSHNAPIIKRGLGPGTDTSAGEDPQKNCRELAADGEVWGQ